MTVYKVKFMSKRNGGILYFILGIPLLLNAEWIFAANRSQGVKYLILLAYAIFSWSMWQIIATGRTDWTLNDQMIKIHWTKKFAFSRVGSNYIVEWSAIEKINKVSTLHFNYLEFVFLNGSDFKYYHDPMVFRDDYEKMVDALEVQMNRKGLQFNYFNKII